MDGQTGERERETDPIKILASLKNLGVSHSDCFEENNTHEITCIWKMYLKHLKFYL